MIIATLYKTAKNKKKQQWIIEVKDDMFRTSEGYIGGAITTTDWTKCEGKNIGRTNETTPHDQAILEAKAKIYKQFDKGWSENIDNEEVLFIAPMLAHKYTDYKDYVKGSLIGVASQPKLDGLRCIGTNKGLFSRNGKPIVAAPHIFTEVLDLLSHLPDNVMIDGELYNHELKADFNKIMSLVRKTKPTAEDLKESESLLQYHIYDMICEGNFIERSDVLSELLCFNTQPVYKYLHLVETYHAANNQETLDKLYQDYLADGYEGQMIRMPNSSYQNCRTKDLLKRKEFQDDEFEIIDIEEGLGNRSGMMGRVKFKMKDGKTFDANARGTHEYFKELLHNKQKYIGKFATVRYQNLTPGESVPRFPVMIDIRFDL